MRTRLTFIAVGLGLLWLLMGAATPFSATYSVEGTLTAGGGERLGSQVEKGYHLEDSLGQAAVGSSWDGIYRLEAGILAWAGAGKKAQEPVKPVEPGGKEEREPVERQ